jgi:hypothetical protein
MNWLRTMPDFTLIIEVCISIHAKYLSRQDQEDLFGESANPLVSSYFFVIHSSAFLQRRLSPKVKVVKMAAAEKVDHKEDLEGGGLRYARRVPKTSHAGW